MFEKNSSFIYPSHYRSASIVGTPPPLPPKPISDEKPKERIPASWDYSYRFGMKGSGTEDDV